MLFDDAVSCYDYLAFVMNERVLRQGTELPGVTTTFCAAAAIFVSLCEELASCHLLAHTVLRSFVDFRENFESLYGALVERH